MSENPYTNLDARALYAQAQRLRELEQRADKDGKNSAEWAGLVVLYNEHPPFAANSQAIKELFAAAQHLQSMDKKLSRRIDGDFAQGALFERRDLIRTRSNLLPSGREIRDEDGARIIAALDQGPERVRRIPAGLRATPKPQVVEIDTRKSAPARTGFKLGDL